MTVKHYQLHTGLPSEIHLVSFSSRIDLADDRDDPQRLGYMHLKDESIERVLLIEGNAL